MLSRIFDAGLRVAAPIVFPGASRRVEAGDVQAGLAPGEALRWTTTRPGPGSTAVRTPEPVAVVVRRPAGVGPASGRCSLFLYGNGMVLADTAPVRAVLADRGAGVVCADYVGYGLSPGTASETGCYRAAHAALDVAEELAGPGGVDVVGWSLGSAVALQLAARRPVRTLVLLSPMSGVSPFLLAPLRLQGTPLRRLGPFAGAGRVGRVRCPALLIVGSDDRLTPPFMARSLADGLSRRPDVRTELALIPGAGHNDLFSRSEVWERVLGFVDDDDKDAAGGAR